jgi:hypothetical protein
MTDLAATYHFEGDEIYAIHEGKVIASGTDMKAVESDAVEYLDSLKTTRDQVAKQNAKKTATHIITPNGVKGSILNRVPDMWGEQVTARFENGEVRSFTVHGETDVQWVTERTASTAANPAEGLEQRLASSYQHDRDSLAKRLGELRSIAVEAHRLVTAGAPYAIQIKLDQVKIAAEHEAREVKEALDHLDAADSQAFQPPKPIVVEQADLGHSADAAGSWLDTVTEDMISEAEGVDYDKMLDEGPAVFVTELDNGALADTGTTREMALSHITSKTAAFQGEEVDEYREKFIARVEVARRHELASRKDTTKKEAAAHEELQTNAPDDALFM